MDTTVWNDRIDHADRYHKKWSEKYKCSTLEKYYRGEHWVGDDERPGAYVLNMVYTTLEIKLASYSFQNIQFHVTPRPSKMDWNIEMAVSSAQNKEDVLNTIVGNPNGRFCDEIEAAIKDSFFRFGIIEVGYSAEWLTNPNAGKPLYLSDTDPSATEPARGPIIEKQPDQIPTNELVYFKRVPALRFRVGGIEGRYLEQCNWVGYYDFYYANDIKSAKNLKNTDKIETVSHRSDEWEVSNEFDELLKKGDLLKVWKIWDLRAKDLILYDQANDVILYEKPFKRLPLFDIRWATDTLGWYPIPPVFNWISPQDEINESRQQMRSYRRRFNRQFQTVRGTVIPEEKDKFMEAKDGALIEVEKQDAITPIADAPLNQVVPQAMIVGKDDLVLVSGTSSESMGNADRITATQSIEISRRFGVRENREKTRVSVWVNKIGREILMTAQEKLISGIWAKATVDPGEGLLGEMNTTPSWQYISSQDLSDGVDYDINVQITSQSPVENQDDKQKFLEFLTLTTQFPSIAMSPMLIREAAYRVGYRNEKVIKEMQNASLLQSMGQMAGAIPPGGQGNKIAQENVASQTPPNIEQTRNQIANQVFRQGA